MADHKLLYRWSLQDAIAHNEVQDWRDSYRENCDCARAIERSIADHYHDNILENGTKDIIDRYGFDRELGAGKYPAGEGSRWPLLPG